MRSPLVPAAAAVLLLGTACADDRTTVLPSDPSQAALVNAAPDLAGVWDWSERTTLHLRPAAVALFGIAAEGPVTTLNCEAWGELTLSQNGAQFSGSATQNSWCVTKGGISFDPSAAFGPGWDLVDGRITGRNVSFTVQTVAFPCPYRGSVRVSGGQVTELSANGHCEVPKELGNDRIRWSATRRQP